MEIEPGKRVKIKTVKENMEGILLECHEPGLYLIKLNSGYNIGIKKEEIIDIQGIGEREKARPEKKKEIKLKQRKNLPKIDVIITGGTISSRLDSRTGGVKWLTEPEDLFKFYPEIFEIADIRKVKIPFMKASENMDYLDWRKIAKEAAESLNSREVEGVIITHGTDFLHYTSSALSFFLKNLNKPVVLTYSQRSSDRASSDASLNLQCAARAAISDIAEVMLVGHASENDDFCFAMPGAKVRKLHSSRRDAFKPVNTKPLAKIWPDKIEMISSAKKRSESRKKTRLDLSFNPKVALIKFFPGMEPEFFEWLSDKYEGVVIEASGLGHLATDESRKNLLPSIKKAIDSGMVICAASQTLYGRLDPLVYSPGRMLKKTGIIFLGDMLSETALVKLGWVLGKEKTREKIKKLMLTDIAGELNDRLEE